MKRRDRSGFTLLELLMVVIIIAILASIALPQYLRVAERARAAEALTVLAAIRSAELRFAAQDPNNAYAALTVAAGNPLDTDIPGYPPVAASLDWAYDATAPVAGSNAVAVRTGGTFGGNQIEIDLDSGATCATNAIWGLPTAAC